MLLATRLLLTVAGITLVAATSREALAQDASESKDPSDAGQSAHSRASASSEDVTVNGQSFTRATRDNSPVARFGEKKQLAISSDAALSISNTSLSGVDGSSTQITLAPAVDYFVIQNLSVGGALSFNYQTSGSGHSTTFGVGPRVGYNVPLSDLLSLWPKAGVSIAHSSVSTDVPAVPPSVPATTRSVSNTAVALNLFVPVMLHPAPHFFVGFGPFLDTDLSGDNKATTFGGKLTLGGWL